MIAEHFGIDFNCMGILGFLMVMFVLNILFGRGVGRAEQEHNEILREIDNVTRAYLDEGLHNYTRHERKTEAKEAYDALLASVEKTEDKLYRWKI